jgi:phosphoglycerol transferase MdoB-like AlkP superfamily enzyme
LTLVFVGASEFTFWNEFSSRFNFIAVDYLIYTKEVIGNIRQSYNLPLLLSVVGVVALAIWWTAFRKARAPLQQLAGTLRSRLGVAGLWVLAAILGVTVADARYKEFSTNAQLNDLAGNGYFEFWHAFWHNEIDYSRFYKTLPREVAHAQLMREMGRAEGAPSARPYERDITATEPRKPLNVVLVSIESFSAEFMRRYGNQQNLTPNMDRLASEGLSFTQLYATGTRTVRGLEALALSIPPTPGHSIVKRPNNGNLFSIGSVFRDLGYESIYLYGGYGYFDNMTGFFSGNGYTVIDRSALASNEIDFENI